MWHGCAKDLSVFLYNTMSHKTIGGVYMVMNGIYLVIASACILILAYRFYGAFIAAKVLTLDEIVQRQLWSTMMVTITCQLTNG